MWVTLRKFRCRSPAGFSACPSFCFAILHIVTCGSPFSSLHSVRSLSLRCFECFHLQFVYLCRGLLFCFSLPLAVLVSDSFNLRCCNILRLLVCAFCVHFPSVSPFSSRVLFPFGFVFNGLTSSVSNSSFWVIPVSCVVLLNDSLSIPFFPVLLTFIVLFVVFGILVLSSSTVATCWAFEGVVRWFPILYDLLVLGS